MSKQATPSPKHVSGSAMKLIWPTSPIDTVFCELKPICGPDAPDKVNRSNMQD